MISVSGSGLVELNTREFLGHTHNDIPPHAVPLKGKYNSSEVVCITLRPHSFQFIQTEPTHGLAGVYIYVKVSLLLSVYSMLSYSETIVKRKYAVKISFSKRL